LQYNLNAIDFNRFSGIGSTLGLGIYVLAGEVASRTAGPAVTLSFFVGMFNYY
jgi:L-asparagine transporter-like permease